MSCLGKYFDIDGSRVKSTATSFVAIEKGDCDSVDDVLQKIDTALSVLKAQKTQGQSIEVDTSGILDSNSLCAASLTGSYVELATTQQTDALKITWNPKISLPSGSEIASTLVEVRGSNGLVTRSTDFISGFLVAYTKLPVKISFVFSVLTECGYVDLKSDYTITTATAIGLNVPLTVLDRAYNPVQNLEIGDYLTILFKQLRTLQAQVYVKQDSTLQSEVTALSQNFDALKQSQYTGEVSYQNENHDIQYVVDDVSVRLTALEDRLTVLENA